MFYFFNKMQELFQIFLQYAKSFSNFLTTCELCFNLLDKMQKNSQLFENKQSVFTLSGVIQP